MKVMLQRMGFFLGGGGAICKVFFLNQIHTKQQMQQHTRILQTVSKPKQLLYKSN
jgi:hypothetical protein